MNITESDISDFLKKYMEAANSRIFSKISDLIHPDALYRFAESDFVGVENIRRAFESAWIDSVEDEKYALVDTRVVMRDERSAVVAYSFNWSGVENGRPFRVTGRGTNVLVWNGVKLQCIYEHLSR